MTVWVKEAWFAENIEPINNKENGSMMGVWQVGRAKEIPTLVGLEPTRDKPK